MSVPFPHKILLIVLFFKETNMTETSLNPSNGAGKCLWFKARSHDHFFYGDTEIRRYGDTEIMNAKSVVQFRRPHSVDVCIRIFKKRDASYMD